MQAKASITSGPYFLPLSPLVGETVILVRFENSFMC